MGVLQRFERRLEGAIEGAFAKVFRGGVEPVEIAKALQREATDKRAVSATRTLVPNAFVVELGGQDHARLAPYAGALGEELSAMVREHAAEHRYAFVGPVTVTLDEQTDVDTGTFRIRSQVIEGPLDEGLALPRTTAQLRVETGRADVTAVPLAQEVTLIGRGSESDLRVTDVEVSRKHAEVRREGDDHVLVDLASTNGTKVNGRRVGRARLVDGDRVQVGGTVLVFERGDH